jgi:tRNA(adenine34) deaminase
MPEFNDEYFMRQALKEAEKGFSNDEIPVGAVMVINDKIIARAHNQTELLKDSTAHAEILALTSAYNFLGSKYLPDAILYVTLEPCPMCAGALYWSKLAKVVYGGRDEKNGFSKCCPANKIFHPKTIVIPGILEQACTRLMKDFFKSKR